MLNFAGKVRQAGNSYVVTIPVAFVECRWLVNGKTYKFSVEESNAIKPV